MNAHTTSRQHTCIVQVYAMLKCMKYLRILSVARQGGATYSYTAIRPANINLLPLDRRFPLIETLLAKSMNCNTRECHKKP